MYYIKKIPSYKNIMLSDKTKSDRIMVGYVLYNKDFVIQKHYFVRQNSVQKLIMYDGMMVVVYYIIFVPSNKNIILSDKKM